MSGTPINAPAGSLFNATATLTGVSPAGAVVNVTPVTANPPSGFAAFSPPSGNTVYGYLGLQNQSNTAITATGATITVTAPASVPSGATCFLALGTSPGAAYTTFGSTSVNGNVYTFTNTPPAGTVITLPAQSTQAYAFYCGPAPIATPAGSVTVVPASGATTPLPTPAGALPGTITVGTVSGTSPLALGPIVTTLPSNAPALPAAFGTPVAYQQTVNTGNGTDTFSGTNKVSVTLPSITAGNLYYLAVNGLPGTSGYVGSFGPGTVSGNTVTFTSNGTFQIPAGATITNAVYSVPSQLTAPSPVPTPVLVNGQAVYPIPGPTNAGANGATTSTNAYLNPPAGTTIQQGAAGGTVTASSLATPAPANAASIGLPTYVSANNSFGGTPIYYGSFVFGGTNSTVTANGGSNQSSSIGATIPNLATYAAANPTVGYYLAPIDTTSGNGYITSGTAGGTTFPVAAIKPSASAPNSAAVGTGAGGTTANQVSFQLSNGIGFTPGVTYGYVIIAK